MNRKLQLNVLENISDEQMDDIYLCVGIWMIFVGYLNVAYIVGQTIESKTDKGFLRYKQYPLFEKS